MATLEGRLALTAAGPATAASVKAQSVRSTSPSGTSKRMFHEFPVWAGDTTSSMGAEGSVTSTTRTAAVEKPPTVTRVLAGAVSSRRSASAMYAWS